MMRAFFFVAMCWVASSAFGQVPMKSAAWASQPVTCNGGDQLMVLDGSGSWQVPAAVPGAGVFPLATSVTVRRVCVNHTINGDGTNSYAVAGHSGLNGDHSTPWGFGTGTWCMEYPKDAPLVFTAGEYFDLHTRCTSGSHYAILQIWYTVP